MKFKKKILGVIAVLSLVGTSQLVFAQQDKEVIEMDNKVKEKSPMAYIYGNVLSVSEKNDGATEVLISDQDGNHTNLIVGYNTYVFGNVKINKGDVVAAYYDTRKPAPAIFPPMYNATVVKTGIRPDTQLKVDYFDENLLSHDGKLKLNINENTEIVDLKGNKYKGDVKGKLLAIEYGITTDSLPSQTSPIVAVVIEDIVDEVVEYNEFFTYEGKVISIEVNKGEKTYFIKGEKDSEAYFTTHSNSYIVDDVKVNDVVTAYVQMQITTMIYPPKYKVDAIAKNSNDRIIKLDYFDNSLTSLDGTLKLNISKEQTEVLTSDNKKYTGDLKNNKLLVIYTTSTRSIPAITVPSKVVLINDIKTIVDTDEISVGNVKIKIKDFGDYKMLPLREIGNALKLNISWDDKTKSIVVGEYKLQIGVQDYMKNNEKIEVGTLAVPILDNDTTYVPIEFAEILIGQ